MGMFVVKVRGVGNHGCQREVKHGEKVEDSCGQPGCVDCLTREFVRKLQAGPASVEMAELVHWPADQGGDPLGEVRDDLVTGVRRGNF